MADRTKVRFELHANVNQAEVWVGDKPVTVTDTGYETSDQAEITALDSHPSVKRASSSKKEKE